MPTYKQPPQNVLELLVQRIETVERELHYLRNQHNPTVPRYDPAALPTMVEFQIFFGTDSTWNVWYNGARYHSALTTP